MCTESLGRHVPAHTGHGPSSVPAGCTQGVLKSQPPCPRCRQLRGIAHALEPLRGPLWGIPPLLHFLPSPASPQVSPGSTSSRNPPHTHPPRGGWEPELRPQSAYWAHQCNGGQRAWTRCGCNWALSLNCGNPAFPLELWSAWAGNGSDGTWQNQEGGWGRHRHPGAEPVLWACCLCCHQELCP